MDLTVFPGTDPVELYRRRDGIYGVDLLVTAIVHLDFFTWLAAKEPQTKAQICAGLELADRPTDVMLTLLSAMGLVRAEAGAFTLTASAREHLVKGSPWFIGPYYASLSEREVARDLIKVMRTGRPANWGSEKAGKDWEKAMEESAFAERFTAAMDCRGVYLSAALAKKVELAGRRSVLDVAGGSGIYACALTARHPHLRATVLDRRPVDGVARRLIRERGFAERVDVATGDMFTDGWPSGHDVHLLSNVLHDWDFPKCRQLLAQSFATLEPGGLLVVHEAFLNAEKTGPLPVAEYSVILMHSTEGKCYSVGEMAELIAEAGFTGFQHQDTVADRGVITATKPG